MMEDISQRMHSPPECYTKEGQPFYPLTQDQFNRMRPGDSVSVKCPAGRTVEITALSLDGCGIIYQYQCRSCGMSELLT